MLLMGSVAGAPEATVAPRLRALAVLADNMHLTDESDAQLLQALTPQEVPLPPRLLQLRRNAVARRELIDEFGLYSSADLADLRNAATENVSAIPSRWLRDGRIFAVPPIGDRRFPAFQFDAAGRPLPVMREILTLLLPLMSGWELALWFTGPNATLDGARPVDRLVDAQEHVIEAARYEVESSLAW